MASCRWPRWSARARDAIAAQEAEIGAFAALDLAGTERQAKSAGERLTTLPLRGLPIGVKDIIDTVDFPTSYGSPIYAGRRSDERCADRLDDPPRRRHCDRENRHHPVRASRPGQDPQSAQPGAHARRFIVGVGRSGCGRHGADRARNPNRRLDHSPGRVFAASPASSRRFACCRRPGSNASPGRSTPPAFSPPSVADAAFATAAITGRDLRVDQQVPAPPRLALVRTHCVGRGKRTPCGPRSRRTARAAEAEGASIERTRAARNLRRRRERVRAAIQDYEA
mgnify:CR=1 FL=1